MNRLKEKRTARRQQNTKLINEARTVIDAADIGTLCSFIERLQTNHDELQKISRDLEETISDEDFASEFETVMKYEDATKGMLGNLKSRVETLRGCQIVQTGASLQPSAETRHRGESTQRSSVKLPTLQLQSFNGELRQWRCFWEQYKEAIHENDRLTKGEKFHYLRSLLSGTAASSIAGLQATGECYDDAVAILSRRFGDTRHIVQEHFSQLRSLPAVVSSDDVRGLRKLLDHVQCHVRGLKGLDVSAATYSTMMTDILLKALPSDIVVGYYKQMASNRSTAASETSSSDAHVGEASTTFPTVPADGELDQLLSYLFIEVESRERSGIGACRENKSKKQDKQESERKRSSPPATSSVLHAQVKTKCLFCDSQHHTTEYCDSEVTRDERLKRLKEENRCFRCTLRGHRSRDCRRRVTCGKCKGRHVSSTCDPTWKPTKVEVTPTVEANSLHTSNLNTVNREILLQTCRLWVVGEASCGYIRGIVDGGSHRTFIREDVSRNLGLQELGKTCLQLSTFGEVSTTPQERRVVQLCLRSQYDDKVYAIEAIEVPFICNDIVQVPVDHDFVKDIEESGYPIADRLLIQGMPAVPGIGLLIGADHLWKFMTGEIRRYPENADFVALGSVFGWMFQGPISVHTSLHVALNVCVLRVSTIYEPTEKVVEKLWDLESIGILDQPKGTVEETEAVMKQFESKIAVVDGRYEVALPWKANSGHIEDNRRSAVKRLERLGKRMLRNEEFGAEYDATLRDYMERNYAERVPLGRNSSTPVYYMPHHAVIRSDSTTTRLRVVFDASSHESGSTSLNEHLERGPCLLADLVKLLIRFRIYRIALTSDIEKAFLQIGVKEEDRDALRFLWFKSMPCREQPEPEIEEWRMTRVPFGTKASPFLLNATLKHHLETIGEPERGTAELLSESFYVDDLVVGAATEDGARQVFLEANSILEAAGMKLRKWSSNSKCLSDLFHSQDGLDTSSDTVKVLGLLWNPQSDKITVATRSVLSALDTGHNCKRSVLQTVARIFDPLGLLAPFTIEAKMAFQELWQRNVDWDDELPTDIEKRWEGWKSELPDLCSLTVHRCVVPTCQPDSVQLHIFCDASQRAYGACAYLRFEDSNGCAYIELIYAKARVAPLKAMTLPRLELMGALLGARVANFLKGCLNTYSSHLQTMYWTDSCITLHWLKGTPSKWNQFVRNRVTEIQGCSDKEQWRHCPGSDNPADRLTRGTSLRCLKRERMWWFGPQWLSHNSEAWPRLNDDVSFAADANLEERKEVSVLLARRIMPILDLAQHSSLLRLLRVTAWVFRFLIICKNPTGTVRSPLTAEEIESAEAYWVKAVQREVYPEEVTNLGQGLPLRSQSSIKKLEPFLDTDERLRVGGRLHFSEEKEEVKHPILLPANHHFTELVIRDAHRRMMHGGTQDTLTELRERFWIPKGRQQVKKVINQCNACLKARLKPGSAPTAPLPPDRVCRSQPFQVVGIDFAGPLFTKDADSFSKSYIALFTCAVTRAVHLELVSSLASETFLLAFRRFTARRGLPSVIYTDNAQTFRKAARDISALKDSLFDGQFQNHCVRTRIRWNFIVERAAWWGGFWERMVKTVKVSLRRVLGKARLTFEELTTILHEVEGLVNSRPLTYLASSPEEPEVLTPAHFLIGKRLTSLPFTCHETPSTKEVVTRRWVHRNQLLEHFWKRWRKDYLLTLRSAHSTANQPSRNITVDDLVLIYEEKAPRHMWKLAKVVEVFPGRDNNIRACMVKLPNGSTLRRPIQLLYPLEFSA